MWNMCLYLFPSCIGQITHPYACIGKSECTDYMMRLLVKFVTIRLSQQLFVVCKTIIGKKVVKVFVTARKSNDIFRLVQSME